MKKKKTNHDVDDISFNIDQVEKLIGKKNMNKFCDFMYGQTCCFRSDGRMGYYKDDVEKFQQFIKEKRNLTSLEWD